VAAFGSRIRVLMLERRIFQPLQSVPHPVIEAFKNDLKGLSTCKGDNPILGEQANTDHAG